MYVASYKGNHLALSEQGPVKILRSLLVFAWLMCSLSVNAQKSVSGITRPAIFGDSSSVALQNDKQGCMTPIDERSFEQFKEKFHDVVRLGMNAITAELNPHCFATSQVSEIIAMSDNENIRLEMAKYLYGFTADPDQFHRVVNMLTAPGHSQKLNEYIKQHTN
jgi:hypothetical protein